mmetsp:Transcript_3258/g.4623  ORF Transcript_3258/g.4623 Transcript_3258/m.4623 type:complete len:235 (-) Transcript_3258:64-768(-)
MRQMACMMAQCSTRATSSALPSTACSASQQTSLVVQQRQHQLHLHQRRRLLQWQLPQHQWQVEQCPLVRRCHGRASQAPCSTSARLASRLVSGLAFSLMPLLACTTAPSSMLLTSRAHPRQASSAHQLRSVLVVLLQPQQQWLHQLLHQPPQHLLLQRQQEALSQWAHERCGTAMPAQSSTWAQLALLPVSGSVWPWTSPMACMMAASLARNTSHAAPSMECSVRPLPCRQPEA